MYEWNMFVIAVINVDVIVSVATIWFFWLQFDFDSILTKNCDIVSIRFQASVKRPTVEPNGPICLWDIFFLNCGVDENISRKTLLEEKKRILLEKVFQELVQVNL